MKRQELEHIIRAAGAITGADHFVILGSSAILGQFPDAPQELRESLDADMYSPRAPEDANLVEGSIGEGSPFHRTFGYYAHGVGEETAVLPKGWKERLVTVRTPGTGNTAGLCLEVHDLAVSKLVAGRHKDTDFVGALLRHHLVSADLLAERLAATPIDDAGRHAAEARLKRLRA
jgi:hypothetical protein